ncbi:EAL domain-containing protein, partial [Pseudoalteromonas ruthenica]
YFEYISQILRRYPQPQLITFEFNETDVLKNFSDMSLMMQSLKAKGANVAVTGVNSGFLTINRILKLPLDAICLEASICENLDEDEMLLSSIEYLA